MYSIIWIPKSAGTSLCQAIHVRKRKTLQSVKYQFCDRGIVTFGHMSYRELIKNGYVSKTYDSGAFKFAIARNPYDRAVSLYFYLKDVANRIPKDQTFLSFLRILHQDGLEPIGLYNVRAFSQCNPQIRWTEGINVDYVGRFENLANDVEKIKSGLGMENIKIPHKNSTIRNHARCYYCDECLELVEFLYEEDFKAFGYQHWKRKGL